MKYSLDYLRKSTLGGILGYFILSIISAATMHRIFGEPSDSSILMQDGVIYVGLLAPMLETPIVVLPTAWMSTLLKSRILLAATLGAMPIILLHGLIGWEKCLAVFPMFLWSTYFYIYRRNMDIGIARVCFDVYLMHAFTNTFAMLIIKT